LGFKDWFKPKEVPFEKKLADLENERIVLLGEQKHHKLTKYLFHFLFLFTCAIVTYFLKGSKLSMILAIALGYMFRIPYWLVNKYSYLLKDQIEDVLKEARVSILKYFMSEFHPNISFDYGERNFLVSGYLESKNITGLPRMTDEIQFQNGDTEIYLAEINLAHSIDSIGRYFKGLFLKIKLENHHFPNGEIRSRKYVAIDKRKKQVDWVKFKKFEESKLSYLTNDEEKFLEEVTPVLPILEHLFSKIKGIRVFFENNEISILLETDMKLFSDNELELGKSFLDEKYYQDLSKKINTFLFIAESLTKDLEKSEVEDRLELKVLSMLPSEMIL